MIMKISLTSMMKMITVSSYEDEDLTITVAMKMSLKRLMEKMKEIRRMKNNSSK